MIVVHNVGVLQRKKQMVSEFFFRLRNTLPLVLIYVKKAQNNRECKPEIIILQESFELIHT